MQQIQSSASNVAQTGNMPNMSTAGNMRNPTVTGSVNGSMISQTGIQQNMSTGGMPFNSSNIPSMMNSGKNFTYEKLNIFLMIIFVSKNSFKNSYF